MCRDRWGKRCCSVNPDDHSAPAAEPQSDPDFISETGTDSSAAVTIPSVYSQGYVGSPTPVFVPKESTPFEKHDDGGPIPHGALWALKYQRHGGFWGAAEATIRERHGRGDSTVYIIDDGRKHCVICRQVGASPDGCTYFLVGRITIDAYEQLTDNEASAQRIFDGARDLCLCVVYEAVAAVSNVAVVESFGSVDDVPTTYLPPSPPVDFADSSDPDL
jgi:hypothetical protein